MAQKLMDKKQKSDNNYSILNSTLDHYVSKNFGGSDNDRWWKKGDEADLESADEIYDKKHDFLKKNIKAASVIPPKMKKDREFPDNMGYFKTRFGTISVGHEKYKKNSEIGFSVVPELIKEKSDIPGEMLEDKDNYFEGGLKKEEENFKASKLSFKYDPHLGTVKKFEEDNDGIIDSERKLLYQDEKEKERLEELEDVRTGKGADISSLDKARNKIREIQEEKEEDNLEFLKEIQKFIEQMENDRLQKILESDEALTRRKRIVELSSNPSIELMEKKELERLLKDMLEKETDKKVSDKFLKIDFSKLSKREIGEIIKDLKRRVQL